MNIILFMHKNSSFYKYSSKTHFFFIIPRLLIFVEPDSEESELPPKQHESCHMQIGPVFPTNGFATSSRTDPLPLLRYRQCYQSTEHTCPPTYPKHVRIGSCTKKLEQIFDFSLFWQNTVTHFPRVRARMALAH